MSDDQPLASVVAPGLRLDEVYGTFHYAVTANDVERFVAGSGDAGLSWQSGVDYISGRLPIGTPAPPVFFIALDPYERGDLDVDDVLDSLDVHWTGGGNAWNEVTYTRPFRVGDRVSVEVRFVDVYEKDGSAGRLLFRVRSNRYRSEAGELIAQSVCAHIRAYDPSSFKEGASVW